MLSTPEFIHVREGSRVPKIPRTSACRKKLAQREFAQLAAHQKCERLLVAAPAKRPTTSFVPIRGKWLEAECLGLQRRSGTRQDYVTGRVPVCSERRRERRFPRDARVALFTAPRDKCGVQQKHISRLNVCPARDVANIARCSALCSDNQTNIKFHIHE